MKTLLRWIVDLIALAVLCVLWALLKPVSNVWISRRYG